MLRWLINRILDGEEKKIGESVDYIRHVVDVSPGAFFRFSSIMPFANSRKVLPVDVWFVAQIVAIQAADCGTCVQIGVNLARQANVDGDLLRAALVGNCDAMPPEMADVYRFSKAVIESSGEEDALRDTLRARYGERGLIELSYVLASGGIPPVVKRTLGYAQSCSAVTVEV